MIQPLVGRLARAYAFVVVSARYLIVLGWLAGAVLAVAYLPSLSASPGADERTGGRRPG